LIKLFSLCSAKKLVAFKTFFSTELSSENKKSKDSFINDVKVLKGG
jgi:hypothetical protein